MPRIAGPCSVVIFGVTGDLARKKLMPVIYDLANRGLLPPSFALVGFARRDWADQDFSQVVLDAVKQHARTPFRQEVWDRLAEGIRFVQGTFDDAKAFDLSSEPEKLRAEYGRSVFGQGCLLARRLIERGVPFIEVSLGTNSGGAGWDTHSDNFNAVKTLSAELDAGWATLMRDLSDRGLLESTTILWMGEFGRTPTINPTAGRDHFPGAWSTVLAGGGIAGGQAYGKTNEGGTAVVDGQIGVEDLLATLAEAIGIGAKATVVSPMGRPTRIAEGKPVKEVLS